MENLLGYGRAAFMLVFLAFLTGLMGINSYASSISGTVYDNQRNALPDVDLELLDDYYRLIGRTRTEGTGRYEFAGLGDGRYTVKALPFRYDFMEQTQSVEIYTTTIRGAGGGNTTEIRDFYLLPRKGSFEEAEARVIFSQEIPKDAKKSYENALSLFQKKRRNEAIVELQKAVQQFPDFFLALNRLGKELVINGNFSEAYPVLIKAADVNPKSPTALYYLGFVLYKLNYFKASLVALTAAYNIIPTSVPLLITTAKVERIEGKYQDAEKHLLSAKKLAKTPIPEIHWELAQLFASNLKKYSEAADELESFLKAQPDAKDAEKIKKTVLELREKAKTKS